jgi:4-hydroxy 2-oxovalerate aldolase
LFYLNNPVYCVEPILELTEYFNKLRYELLWGYQMPYAITGYHNLHPSSAIKRMNSTSKFDALGMYQQLRNRHKKSS